MDLLGKLMKEREIYIFLFLFYECVGNYSNGECMQRPIFFFSLGDNDFIYKIESVWRIFFLNYNCRTVGSDVKVFVMIIFDRCITIEIRVHFDIFDLLISC